MTTYYSLDATVQLFDDTEREINLVFDGISEMIESLRPHPINYTNITLPRSKIVPQMQKFLEESKQKDQKIQSLQQQINALNASFAHQEAATDLRAEYHARVRELEEERSFTEELEELQKPLYAQIDELKEELLHLNEWATETESQIRRDYRNEMEIKHESYLRFEKSQNQIIEDAREAFGLLLEQLNAVIQENRELRTIPRPKVIPEDLEEFAEWTAQFVSSRLSDAVKIIHGMLNSSFQPQKVYYKPEILKIVQQGLQFQSEKIAQIPVEIPPEFDKENAPEQFPPTPSDEPDVTSFRFPDFSQTKPVTTPPLLKVVLEDSVESNIGDLPPNDPEQPTDLE